jgi:hypothetical protein
MRLMAVVGDCGPCRAGSLSCIKAATVLRAEREQMRRSHGCVRSWNLFHASAGIGMSSTNTYIIPLAMLAIALMLIAVALWL